LIAIDKTDIVLVINMIFSNYVIYKVKYLQLNVWTLVIGNKVTKPKWQYSDRHCPKDVYQQPGVQ